MLKDLILKHYPVGKQLGDVHHGHCYSEFQPSAVERMRECHWVKINGLFSLAATLEPDHTVLGHAVQVHIGLAALQP